MVETLNITWQMFNPPIAAKSWRQWTHADFANIPLVIDESNSLLSHTVEQVLIQALNERLPRSTGWSTDSALNEPLKAAVKAAANIYKRGVPYSESGAAFTPDTEKGSYPVQIVETNAEIMAAINSDNFLIVDQNVYKHHRNLFAKRSDVLVLQLDEHSKNLTNVRHIIAAWNQSRKAKNWCLIGGGILTDTAAFAASLCQCKSEFIPTTLLAMADACVGGKTGVNAENFGKNLIGRFYFPQKVIAWPGWLTSLDQRQLAAGAFECLKHFFLKNDVTAASAFADLIVKNNLAEVAATLPTIVKVKADVVEQDPAETGKRAVLNLGHTLGHAVEGLSQKLTTGLDTILHGEAVGVGMMFAIFLSTKLSGLSEADAKERIDILKKVSQVNTQSSLKRFFAGKDPAISQVIDELQKFITQDKKATDDSSEQSQWILLTSSGEVKGPSNGTWTYTLDMSSFPRLWQDFLKKYC